MEKLELRLFAFRKFREHRFKAFDLWEKAVIRGREVESTEVMNWYQAMLDFPRTITENTTYADYPSIPDVIQKYIERG